MVLVLSLVPILKQQFIEHINGRSQGNKQNQTYYFFDDIIDIRNFHSNLLKIDKKSHKTLIFIILVTLRLRSLVIVKILIV